MEITQERLIKQQARVLVTGGTGFLGRRLVEYLVQQGERIRVLGRRTVARWRHNDLIEHIRADIAEPGVIEEALEGVGQVYHLAAATQGDLATHMAVTVDGSARLFESFASQGGGRMVFVSSLIVFDGNLMRDGVIVDEKFPLEQNFDFLGNYARAKVQAERIAQTYLAHPLIKLTIIRPGVIYGPQVKNPLNGVAYPVKGKLLVVLGKGDKLVPLIYIDDVVHALIEIMRNEQTIGCIYNLVHPQAPTQNEYLALYRKLSDDNRPLIRIPKEIAVLLLSFAESAFRVAGNRKPHLRRKAVRATRRVEYSSKQLKKDIGFEPSVSFSEGLHRMLRRSKNDC